MFKKLVLPIAAEGRLFLFLRVGVALCFIGHGAFGLLRKEAWIPYFGLVGIGPGLAHHLMPVVGTVDILIGVLALLWPAGAVFAYAAGWALMTATLRPLAGEGIWETLERAGNYGVPMAALILAGLPATLQRWFVPVRAAPLDARRSANVLLAARWTTALLLIGHGALAVGGKPLLLEHGATIGAGANLVRAAGMAEILAGVWLLFSHSALLFIAVAGWKLVTEALFVAAGDPIWEWVERGGSYVAPLTAAGLITYTRRAAHAARETAPSPRKEWARASAAGVGAGVLLVLCSLLPPPVAQLSAQEPVPPLDAAVLERLQSGSLILACRHAATDPNAPDAPERFAVRPLTAEGEAQAKRMGELLRALRIPVSEVLSSPYARTMRTAELAFGRAEREDALWSSGRREEVRARLFSDPPTTGNRILMTHQGILYRTLPVPRGSIEEGDCVVLEGQGRQGFRVLGKASNGDWERLLREPRRTG